MALIKKRPRVRLEAPAVLTPGESFEATLIVEADKPLPVNAITVELSGVEEVHTGSGDTTTTKRNEVARLAGRLSGRTELNKGVRNYPFTLRLPNDAPPTFFDRGTYAEHVSVRYSYDVRVDIPWWPDRRASFQAVVGYAGRPEPRAQAVISESAPLGRGPHLELSLASDVISAGGELTGAIALGNRSQVDYRSLEVALVSDCVRMIGGQRQSDEHSRSASAVQLPEGDASITFTRRLAPETAPTFESRHWSLLWSVEVTAHVARKADVVVRVPVRVEPAYANKPRRRLAPPIVGRERVEGIWRNLGARHGLMVKADTLSGRFGQCVVTILREFQRGGHLLVAELSYPSLRLGLATRARLLSGPEITGRDPGQTQWLVARLPIYRGIELELEDERLRLTHPGTGQDEERLNVFVTAALHFARVIPRPGEAPVAESMKGWLPVWRELANVVEGELNVGDLSVRGRLGGCAVEVWHRWPKRGAAKTLLSARPPGELRTPNVELKWDALGAEAQPLRQKGATLRALDDRLVLEAPFQLDAALLVPKLRALAKLARQ